MKNNSNPNVLNFPNKPTHVLRRNLGRAAYELADMFNNDAPISYEAEAPIYRNYSTETLAGDGLPSHVKLLGANAVGQVIDFETRKQI